MLLIQLLSPHNQSLVALWVQLVVQTNAWPIDVDSNPAAEQEPIEPVWMLHLGCVEFSCCGLQADMQQLILELTRVSAVLVTDPGLTDPRPGGSADRSGERPGVWLRGEPAPSATDADEADEADKDDADEADKDGADEAEAGEAAAILLAGLHCSMAQGTPSVLKRRNKRTRKECEHGRRRYQCKECGGSGICEHGRRRERCKECGGSGICEHGRERRCCKECGGSGICEHGRQRSWCKECGGSGICEHGRQR